ncbi:MAG: DNA polymerase III subunit delta [Anaerolineales bacterium]|nr:DNA polymerase III subunit delta [Chloroflexota bacterium]MBL6980660.1 DNA polymerase III subunit delta [Anaerolineales bacterium]
MADKPVIYILHGDDEYAIAQFISNMEAKLGDPSTAGLNITYFEKGSLPLDEISTVVHSMPFLAERRLIVLHDPLTGMQSSKVRDQFKVLLEKVPPTSALVMAINRPLIPHRDRRKGKQHWLQKWAQEHEGRVYEKELFLARGPELVRWIQQQAKEERGEITSEGAALLANLVDEDPRIAAQEIKKLLAYVNYSRPIEPDDVEYLVANVRGGDVFAMVDALGEQNGQKALRMLHQLLADDDPLRLFGMIVRQFRLLLLTREMIDMGYQENEIARELKTFPFVVRKLIPQTRNFSMETLEDIYRRLLDIDENIKTGKIEGDVALDTLVTALTA